MLDLVELERKGVPSVGLIHERFKVAALTQLELAGMPSAKVVTIPEGEPGETFEAQYAKINDNIWDKIVAALVAS